MLYQQIRPPFWQRHPYVTAAGALAGYWLIVNGWYVTVAMLAAVTLMIAIAKRRRAAEQHRAGLRARAELEHRLVLAGDPRGTYGRYPPVQPGWFADPQDRRRVRYFDGATWTWHTAPR